MENDFPEEKHFNLRLHLEKLLSFSENNRYCSMPCLINSIMPGTHKIAKHTLKIF